MRGGRCSRKGLQVLRVAREDGRGDERVRECVDERNGERDARGREQVALERAVRARADDDLAQRGGVGAERGESRVVEHEAVPQAVARDVAVEDACELVAPREGEEERFFGVGENGVCEGVEMVGFDEEDGGRREGEESCCRKIVEAF